MQSKIDKKTVTEISVRSNISQFFKKIPLFNTKFNKETKNFLSFDDDGYQTSPLPRITLWCVVAVSALGIAWACIGEIDVVASVPGRIIPDGRVKTIQAPVSGVIKHLFVKEGALVKKGDPILEFDSTTALADTQASDAKLAFMRAQLARLNAEFTGHAPDYSESNASPDLIALQESLRVARSVAFHSRLTEAENLFESKKQIASAGAENLMKMTNAVITAQEKEERIRPYIGTVMTRFDYLNLKSQLEQNKGDLAIQEKNLADARQQAAASRQRLDQITNDERSKVKAEISDTSNQLLSLQSASIRARQALSDQIIRSPIDGQLQNLLVSTIGGVSTAGKVIGTVVPVDVGLVVEALMTNSDAGFTKVGQKVDVKIDTFPSQIYGSIEGVISAISPDSENSSAQNDNIDNRVTSTDNKMFYRVRIELKKHWIKVGATQKLLSPGMSVQADITTDQRKIITFFIQPLTKAFEDGLHVR